MTSDGIDPVALAILRTTPTVLRTLLGGLPAGTLTRANPEGWSIKDIVAHLLDAEGIEFTERIRRIVEEEQPFIHSIDPPARLQQGGYAARTFDDVLDSLARQRAESMALLDSLTTPQLARTGRHDSAGAISHQWAFHDLAHTRQIMEMLQAGVVPGMGNTRTFYPEAAALLAWQ